jgi:lipopolysaccharide biosynthesis glycosyltransferase
MLTSLLENATNRDLIKIFIIDGKISEENKNKLNEVVNRYGNEITFLSPKNKLFKVLPKNSTIGYITKETYFRLGLPRLLDKKIKKVLYLDCDLIVKGDISELWKVKIKNHYLAAVDESCLFDSQRKKILVSELRLTRNSPYFNAGVLLLNIDKWRKNKVTTRILKYLQKRPALRFMDQDALNVVLYKKWLQLDYKWNYTTYHWKVLPDVEPSIIHFCGWNKPWNSDIRYKEDYFKYLELSNWNASEEQ